MWLILGLCLTSSLIHSGNMLKCLECADLSCPSSSSVTCADNHVCGVSKTVIKDKDGSSLELQRGCLIPEMCLDKTKPATASVGILFQNTSATMSCCPANDCNNVIPPEPNKVINGLKCFTCKSLHDKQCNEMQSCVGEQNRCFHDEVSALPFNLGKDTKNVKLKGCVTKNLCKESFNGNLSCCAGYLCNKSTTWLRDFNIGLLLMSLITAVSLQ